MLDRIAALKNFIQVITAYAYHLSCNLSVIPSPAQAVSPRERYAD
jgi:hypothetical protein